MKAKLLLILLATSFIWVSCAEKETYEPETPSQEQSKMERRKISITASLSSGTKTSLGLNDAVLWSVGDKISIFYNGVKSEFVSTNTEPSESAVFEGYVDVPTEAVNEQLQLYGVYPHNSANTMSDGQIKITLPSGQSAVEGSFANNLSISAGKSNGLSMKFYNVCGLLEFTVEGSDVYKVTLKGNNEESPESLSGVLSVQFGGDGIPAVSSIGSAGNEISLSKADGKPLTPGEKYYMVVPPVTLANGATFSFVKSDGVIWKKVIETPITISRSGIKTEEKIDNGAQNTGVKYVEFDDETFQSYCLANFDSDEDRRISSTEAETVEAIRFESGEKKWVNSLKGIEYFTNLKVLICSNTPADYYNDKDTPDENGLKSLDLSSNTKLVELRLGTQPFLKNVNITGCNDLEILVIHGSYTHHKKIDGVYTSTQQVYRSLQKVDLSGKSKLEELSCSGLLSEEVLDISALNCLKYLNISDSEIKGISFSASAPLTKLSIYDCKKITSLDISHYTNLEELHLLDDGITSIDLSNQQALKRLAVDDIAIITVPQGGFVGLDYLSIAGGKDSDLTNFNVTGELFIGGLCAGVKWSTCPDITKLRVGTQVSETLDLSPCANLQSLKIYNNSNVSKLKIVDIRNNVNLTEYDSSNCPGIETLYVGLGQQIEGVTPNRSGECIHQNTAILQDGGITTEGFKRETSTGGNGTGEGGNDGGTVGW